MSIQQKTITQFWAQCDSCEAKIDAPPSYSGDEAGRLARDRGWAVGLMPIFFQQDKSASARLVICPACIRKLADLTPADKPEPRKRTA